MLLAKDFKTAVAVVIAVAGLLGFGTANATVLLSETNAAGEAASTPAIFAAEMYPSILPAAPSREGGTPIATTTLANTLAVEVGDLSADGMTGGVDIALLVGDRYYIRFDLMNGAAFSDGFNSNPFVRRGPDNTGELRNTTQRVRAGRDGDAHGIWTFTVTDTTPGGMNDPNPTDTATGADSAVDGLVTAGAWTVELGSAALRFGAIRLPRNQSATERSCYGMRFRLYDNSTSARNALDALVDAQATLMCFVPTLGASVSAPQSLTASVATGFRRFTGASPASGRLATATVSVARATPWVRASTPPARVMLPIQNPSDGGTFMDSDVLKHVAFSLTGSFTHSSPFGFGEFKLGSATMTRIDAGGDPISAAANRTAEGKASTAMVTGRMAAAGSMAISVDVSANNAASPTNIYEAIGQGSYTAEWEIDQADPGTGQGAEQNPGGGEAPAGSIMRDGTTVRVGYLQTVTELERDGDIIGWNQRLVITNHGSIAADVTLGDYNAEEGVTVTCKMPPTMPVDKTGMWTCGDNEEVMTTIGANSQLVLRVAELIATEGGGRTSGMLTIAQDSSQISVASTHVTLPGGQTDTVRYWPLQ